MTRRGLLFSGLAFALKAAQPDELMDRYNKFADLANLWTRRRNEGIIDTVNMKKSEQQFERVTHSEGWPR